MIMIAAVALLATGTGVAFAATTSVSNVGVTSLGDYATVTAAGSSGKWGAAPAWDPVTGVPGQIPDSAAGNTAGDLFIVDTSQYAGDVYLTLYMTNGAELTGAYSYLNLGITVYEWDSTLNTGAGGWESTPVAGVSGSTPNAFVGITNGFVTFRLAETANGGKYSVGIDSGSFYPISAVAADLSPDFFVDVRPA
jgi:hypothetical protein